MKQILKRWRGRKVFVYLPYGLCLVGHLRQDLQAQGGFQVMVNSHNMTRVLFDPDDVIAVNNSGNKAFWLKGSLPPILPHIKLIAP